MTSRRLVLIIVSILLISCMGISKNVNADDIGLPDSTNESLYTNLSRLGMIASYPGISATYAGTSASAYGGPGYAYGFACTSGLFGQSCSNSQVIGYTPNSFNMAYNWTSGGGITLPYGSNLFSIFSPYSNSYSQSVLGYSESSGESRSFLGQSLSGSSAESTGLYSNVISRGYTGGGSMYLPFPSPSFLGNMFSPSLGIGIGVAFSPNGGSAVATGSAGVSSP